MTQGFWRLLTFHDIDWRQPQRDANLTLSSSLVACELGTDSAFSCCPSRARKAFEGAASEDALPSVAGAVQHAFYIDHGRIFSDGKTMHDEIGIHGNLRARYGSRTSACASRALKRFGQLVEVIEDSLNGRKAGKPIEKIGDYADASLCSFLSAVLDMILGTAYSSPTRNDKGILKEYP